MQDVNASNSLPNTTKRYAQVFLFTAIYTGIGFLFRLSPGAYLLAGIPITFLFQRFIAKQPLHRLWLRHEQKFVMPATGWGIAVCLMVLPACQLAAAIAAGSLSGVMLGYRLATLLGAIGAGYCLSRLTVKTAKELLFCFSTAALLRSVLYFLPFILGKRDLQFHYIDALISLLTYIPVAFVVEEVVFRGMLDAHVHPSSETRGLESALFISCVWGLWHLPLSGNLWSLVISSWGILLSLFWRRSGNLAVPAFSHAFADAIRDVVGHGA